MDSGQDYPALSVFRNADSGYRVGAQVDDINLKSVSTPITLSTIRHLILPLVNLDAWRVAAELHNLPSVPLNCI